MRYESTDVFKQLSEYRNIHKRYSPDISYLNVSSDAEIDYNTDDVDLEPPKFLADLFESVAGAIYLDSNCSLNTVWQSYYAMLEPYLGKKNPSKINYYFD
jgi:dsRNA-specific ribonuclease